MLSMSARKKQKFNRGSRDLSKKTPTFGLCYMRKNETRGLWES